MRGRSGVFAELGVPDMRGIDGREVRGEVDELHRRKSEAIEKADSDLVHSRSGNGPTGFPGFGAGTAGAAPGPGMPGPGPHIVGGFGHGHLLPPGQIKRVCPWQAPPGYWVGGPHGVPCT